MNTNTSDPFDRELTPVEAHPEYQELVFRQRLAIQEMEHGFSLDRIRLAIKLKKSLKEDT